MRQNFQLNEVLKTTWKNKGKIILFTLFAAAIGAILTYILPKQYQSNSYFIVKPHIYNSRPSTFITDYFGEITYEGFANEKEVDIVEGILNSSYFKDRIARLVTENKALYGVDEFSSKQVNNSFKFKRNAQRVQKIVVTSKDSNFSSQLGKLIIEQINIEFKGYFQDNFTQKKEVLEHELSTIKNQIGLLDIDIENTRSKYGLHTELAPIRGEGLISASNQTIKAGIEDLYNLIQSKEELLKTSLWIERSIIQYNTLISDPQLDMIYIMTDAHQPNHHVFPNLKWMVIIGSILGFFISVLGIIVVQIPRK